MNVVLLVPVGVLDSCAQREEVDGFPPPSLPLLSSLSLTTATVFFFFFSFFAFFSFLLFLSFFDALWGMASVRHVKTA